MKGKCKIMSNLPRMRTRDKAIALLRQEDPDTCMSKNAINTLIKSGRLPTAKFGNKILINYDALLEIVAAGGFEVEEEPQEPGTIRRIEI